MATIAKLAVELSLEDNAFKRGLQNTQDQLNEWGRSLRETGSMFTEKYTKPLLRGAIATVNMASDLEQAMGKTEAVFGDATDSVIEWSKGSAKAYGFAQSDALAMTATYGSLFKVMGFTNDLAADYSMSLIGLSADMAAFNDVSNDRASQALMAGLTGEYMSLRSMGIFLNEAAVSQEALTIAQAEGRSEITDSDKVLARYNLILKQTAQQQGQAAREAKGWASRVPQLRAQLKNLGATIGQQLTPYALVLLDWIEKIVSGFQNLNRPIQQFIVIVLGVVAALGPLLIALGILMPLLSAGLGVFAALVSPIGLVVVALAALAAGVIYAYTHFEGFRNVVDSVIGKIKDAISVISTFTAAFDKIQTKKEIEISVSGDDSYIEWQEQPDGSIKYAVMHVNDDGSISQIGEVIDSYTDPNDPNIAHILIKGDDGEYWTTIDKTTGEIGDATIKVTADTEEAQKQIGGVLAGLLRIRQAAEDRGMPMLEGIARYAAMAVAGVQGLIWFFQDLKQAVTDTIQIGETLSDIGYGWLQNMADGAERKWGELGEWFGTRKDQAVTLIGSLSDILKQQGSDLFDGLWTGAKSKWEEIRTWVTGRPDQISTAIGDLTTTLLQKGKDVLDGLWTGAKSKWEEIRTWVTGRPAQVVTAIGDITSTLTQKGKDLLNGLWSGAKTIWTSINTWLAARPQQAVNAIGSVTNTLYQKGIDLFTGFWNGMLLMWSSLSVWLNGLGGLIASGVGDLSGALWDAGVQIINGLIGGIQSMAGSAIDAAKGVVSDAIEGAKNLLGINSPSKVFAWIGEMSIAGWVQAFDRNARKMVRPVEVAARDVSRVPFDIAEAADMASLSEGSTYGHGVDRLRAQTQPIINNYYALTPEDLERVLKDSRDGAGFARQFGAELAMRGGL
ncbi:MAG TPA: hypothetical protein VNZ58_03665 [Thermomicrobiales bacterium]|nr:hypothetical protein [Thermomicrobiales bacterium]